MTPSRAHQQHQRSPERSWPHDRSLDSVSYARVHLSTGAVPLQEDQNRHRLSVWSACERGVPERQRTAIANLVERVPGLSPLTSHHDGTAMLAATPERAETSADTS